MALEANIETLTAAVKELTTAINAMRIGAAEAPDEEKPATRKPAAKKPAAKKPAAKKPAAKKPAAKKPAEVELRTDIDIAGLRKLAGAYMATEDPEAREMAKANVRGAFDHLGAKVLTDLEDQAQMTSLGAYIDTWMGNDGAKIDFEAIDERVAEALGDPDDDPLLG